MLLVLFTAWCSNKTVVFGPQAQTSMVNSAMARQHLRTDLSDLRHLKTVRRTTPPHTHIVHFYWFVVYHLTTAMHPTVVLTSTAKMVDIAVVGRKSTNDGRNWQAENICMNLMCCVDCLFTIGAILHTFHVDRFHPIDIGRSTQHYFESRWQPLEHHSFLAK